MSKMRKEYSGADGWTRRLFPTMGRKGPYRMACCDCGLVHDVVFTVHKTKSIGGGAFSVKPPTDRGLRVAIKVRRNERSTAAMRREEKKRGVK